MNCKKGDLAVVVSDSPAQDMIVLCVAPYNGGWLDGSMRPGWILDRPIPKINGTRDEYIADEFLRPIRDQPGNESFVTEARKSLPRPKDAVTITERGELA